MKDHGFFGGVYGMAFIGAAIYYIQQAHTFWAGVVGIGKALFWPAILMYKLLEYLKM
jgi:formate-dependent nitrite reductase membrane component NrfD